jgi:hypothetical protein
MEKLGHVSSLSLSLVQRCDDNNGGAVAIVYASDCSVASSLGIVKVRTPVKLGVSFFRFMFLSHSSRDNRARKSLPLPRHFHFRK